MIATLRRKSRQVAASHRALNDRVESFLGLGKTASQTELKWFRQNRTVAIGNGRDLLMKLSSFVMHLRQGTARSS